MKLVLAGIEHLHILVAPRRGAWVETARPNA